LTPCVCQRDNSLKKKMTQIELAAYIQSHLWKMGINVVLSGARLLRFTASAEQAGVDVFLTNNDQILKIAGRK